MKFTNICVWPCKYRGADKSLAWPGRKQATATKLQNHILRSCECASNKFLCNKTNQMHQFYKFNLPWNSKCFGQFLCPSSGVYSLYTKQWYMTYRFVVSFRAGPGWNSVPSWSYSKVSWQNKFVKLVHLVGFITKKFVTMHGHTNVKKFD